MRVANLGRGALAAVLLTALGACGAPDDPATQARIDSQLANTPAAPERRDRETVWDLFDRGDPERNVEVNRYIWSAAQEILDFLPLETADPFTGVLAYGYGTPPGGGPAYRATVYVQDPALDARSLNLALATRSGPVNAATARAVEDAILTRARQLRLEAADL